MKLDIEFYVLKLPNDAFLPNLKILHLKSIMFRNDGSVKILFSSCISLEEMVMDGCNLTNISSFNFSHNLLKRLTLVCSKIWKSTSKCQIVIDAPKLVYFKHDYDKAEGYSLMNLESLFSADIGFNILCPDSHDRHEDHDATQLFRGIHNVQSLNLSSTSLKVCC